MPSLIDIPFVSDKKLQRKNSFDMCTQLSAVQNTGFSEPNIINQFGAAFEAGCRWCFPSPHVSGLEEACLAGYKRRPTGPLATVSLK